VTEACIAAPAAVNTARPKAVTTLLFTLLFTHLFTLFFTPFFTLSVQPREEKREEMREEKREELREKGREELREKGREMKKGIGERRGVSRQDSSSPTIPPVTDSPIPFWHGPPCPPTDKSSAIFPARALRRSSSHIRLTGSPSP
jgi:hypothetical protein